jgi:hypothetical protein
MFKAAGALFKPAAGATKISAEQMADDWSEWWQPGSDGGGSKCTIPHEVRVQSWQQAASDGDIPKVEQKQWEDPSADRLFEIAMKQKGAAGLDGWAPAEIRALARYFPTVFAELVSLLSATTKGTTTGSESAAVIAENFVIRVPGIPKRGSDEARPIAVCSVLSRMWCKHLFSAWFPPMPDGQWAGVAGQSVTTATLDWKDFHSKLGAELDLSKAFDSVSLEVAVAALRWAGVPEEVVLYLSALWRAPRRCHIDGALSREIHPTSGLPPGDACSPASLALVLAPWSGIIVKFCKAVKPWLYCDDRSLRVRDVGSRQWQQEQRQLALGLTAKFDTSLGLVENGKKRQLWEEEQEVEHLGLISAVEHNAVPTA